MTIETTEVSGNNGSRNNSTHHDKMKATSTTATKYPAINNANN